MKSKLGVTPASIVLIVIIMIILLSTIVIKSDDIVATSKVKKIANEFFQIETLVKEYNVRKSGILNFDEVVIDTTDYTAAQMLQYKEENIIDSEIMLYEVDLSKIGVDKVTYGIKKVETDRYLFSTKTRKVYYEKGFNIKSLHKTYYTLTEELMGYIK